MKKRTHWFLSGLPEKFFKSVHFYVAEILVQCPTIGKFGWETTPPASAIFHSFFLKLNDIFHSHRWWLVVSQNFGDILSIFVFELLMHGWKVCMVFGVIYVQFSTFLCDSKFWFSKIIYFLGHIFPLVMLTFSLNIPLRTLAQKQ